MIVVLQIKTKKESLLFQPKFWEQNLFVRKLKCVFTINLIKVVLVNALVMYGFDALKQAVDTYNFCLL